MALTPYQLYEIPNNIVKLYDDLEDYIIDDICRRISKTGIITETGKWQIDRAGNFGYSLDNIKSRIQETLNLSNKEIDKLFKDAAIKSIKQDNVLYKQAKLTPIHYQKEPQLQQYLAAAAKQTKGEFKNLTKTLGFVLNTGGKKVNKSLSQAYIDTVNFASMQVNSGVCSYQTAIRNAVKSLSNSGVRVISYESGWNNRLDVAVRRATLTGANQMSTNMTRFIHDSLVPTDEQYVEVTAHSGARPSHRVWQGQVYKVEGSTDKYPNLAESTGYGTGEGLCGWNCRHSFFPFIPGVSTRTYSDEELKNIDPPPFIYNGKEYSYYEATQMQRKMERDIRATKREIIGYNAIGDQDAFTTASIKLQQQKKVYRNFSKKAGIRVKDERNQVLNYNHSVSSKSAWSVKKNTLSDDEILAINKYISSDSYKINEKLRYDLNLTDNDKKFIKDLDSALNKMPNYKGDLTRSIQFYDRERMLEFFEDHKVGRIVTYKEYISATKGEIYNEAAQIQIYILDSTKGINISKYNEDEQEILYKRNTQFIVKEIELINGVAHILMEEI